MSLFAAIDWGALGKVVVASLIATFLFTLTVCTVIITGTRAAEFARAGQTGPRVVYTALAVVSLLVLAGLIVFGLIVMTSK
jgi:hypothetical protein